MMQAFFLRVFVVGLGLIMYPREDPCVEEVDLISNKPEWEEKLLKEMERLNQEIELEKYRPDGPFVDLKSQEESLESTTDHEATQIKTISLLENFEMTVTLTYPNVLHENANHMASMRQLHIEDSDHERSQKDQSRYENYPRSLEMSETHEYTVPNIKKGEQQDNIDIPCVNKKNEINSNNYFSNLQTLLGQKEGLELENGIPSSEQEVKLPQPYTNTAAEYHTDKVPTWENDLMWLFWNMYSIISVINFIYRHVRKNSQNHISQNTLSGNIKISNLKNFSADVKLPDNDILHKFYNKCLHCSPSESGRIVEFVEGIAHDLSETMRKMRDKNVGMVMKDFEVVEDACGPGVFKIIIPFLPFEPHSFQFEIWNSRDRSLQGWYKIKMVASVNKGDCPCVSSNNGRDLLCLLHCETESVEQITELFDGPLCKENTPYLSQIKVKQWFRNEIRRAWEHISHKYEFMFSYKVSTATVTVRFRSGKVMSFHLVPAVKLPDTEAYFTIAPCSTNKATSEITWSPSFTIYENRFLNHLVKRTPKLSCHLQSLNIVLFLHQKQTVLTGRCALKQQHYKIALMHLLISKEPSDWHPKNLASRIRDLLNFIENSLHQRLLNQISLKAPTVPKEVEMPSVFHETTPVNLFYPLVVENYIYIRTIHHFQEMMKNTPVLIKEYLSSN